MASLEISETQKEGEHRWGVTLITDENVDVLRTTNSLAKGVALSTAKALKHKGPDAPFVGDRPPSFDRPYWVAKKGPKGWMVEFTLVSETPFDLFLKPEDATGDPKIVETAVATVKATLSKAEIQWNPPEADPAYAEKETDLTPTVGHPGS